MPVQWQDGGGTYSSNPFGGDGWSAPRPGRFNPGEDTVPVVQEAGWALGPRFDPRAVQPVASRYTGRPLVWLGG